MNLPKIPFHAHLTGPYIWFAIILGILIVLLFVWQIDFIKECLSDDKKQGSGGKLMGMATILTACFCEIFHVIKQQAFDLNHLVCFLLSGLLFYSVIKFSDVIAMKFGLKQPDPKPDDAEKKTVTVNTATEITQNG
jgi:hypothetical protein